MRRILYLAAGLLLAVETSNAAPAQNSVPTRWLTRLMSISFPAPPPRKAWTERLLRVTEELAAAGSVPPNAKGTREGIRDCRKRAMMRFRAAWCLSIRRAGTGRQAVGVARHDDELDEMLQRLDALQTPRSRTWATDPSSPALRLERPT